MKRIVVVALLSLSSIACSSSAPVPEATVIPPAPGSRDAGAGCDRMVIAVEGSSTISIADVTSYSSSGPGLYDLVIDPKEQTMRIVGKRKGTSSLLLVTKTGQRCLDIAVE